MAGGGRHEALDVGRAVEHGQLVARVARRVVDAHRAWLAEVERELGGSG